MSSPGNVLMVCLGNICRSPLAHGIFTSLSSQYDIEVDSAGTANYHQGNPPDKRSIAVAKKHGIDISQQKARQFVANDFDRFDNIFVMDKQNYRNVCALARRDEDLKKVKLLLGTQEVEDPYYGGNEGFDLVYRKIHSACTQIISSWQKT